jgi:polyribonucleotide nucleotidyltransferase
MRQDRGWVPVQANGQIMFDYIDMMIMLQLTAEVVKVNLIDFFPMSLPKEPAGTSTRMQ